MTLIIVGNLLNKPHSIIISTASHAPLPPLTSVVGHGRPPIGLNRNPEDKARMEQLRNEDIARYSRERDSRESQTTVEVSADPSLAKMKSDLNQVARKRTKNGAPREKPNSPVPGEYVAGVKPFSPAPTEGLLSTKQSDKED